MTDIAGEPVPLEAPAAPATDIPVPGAEPPVEAKKKAVVVANGKVPANENRFVVIVEHRNDEGLLADTKYGLKGDAYLRMSEEVDFGNVPSDKIHTLGFNIEQGTFHGLSTKWPVVNTGPSHPAYAGINLAYLLGARDIEVVGLTDLWKERLQPYLDTLFKDPATPSDLKIQLT